MAAVRNLSFRYRLLRNGGNYGLLEPIEGRWPTIRMDDGGEIKTSLSGSFAPPDFEVEWLKDEIQPELIIDGEAYPLGIFLPATVEAIRDETTVSLRIEAYDRGWLVRDYKAETVPYFAAGTNYLSAVGSLLHTAGIGLVSQKATALALTEAREDWSPGTGYLEIANELLREINYKDVWFDDSGMARLEPFEDLSAANIKHTLDEKDVKSLLLPTISRSTDVYSAPNVFICICSNPDKESGMTATAVNTSAQSPLSVGRRGRRIVQVTQVRNVASQEELQALADRQLTDSLIGGEIIRVETGLLPGFGVGDVTALRYGDVFAVCREREWTMELSPGGTMTHVLERQVLQIG